MEMETNGAYPSDLACERRRADLNTEGVEFRREFSEDYEWERIKITSEAGARSIGRPMGIYDTLNLGKMDTLDEEEIYDAAEEVAKELCRICDSEGIDPSRILVVGLGNRSLTPDSIGPLTALSVNATMHIRSFSQGLFCEFDCSEIAILAPGVLAESGMDSTQTVIAVSASLNPTLIIAIDALAAKDAARLGRTIQFSNAGIFPGSGVGNTRMALDRSTTGVHVISVGIPTVISTEALLLGDSKDGDARAVADTIKKRGLEGMFVSPKEIDGIVSVGARIVSHGINQAFGIL